MAESVDVIQSPPAIAFPFDGVSETLKHESTVAVGTCEALARGLERYTGEPERGAIGG
jgi:antirestriction protein ArdC